LPVEQGERDQERPQDEWGDGPGLETADYGGEYDDDMPQEIRVTDKKRRRCVYRIATVNGRAVNSIGFIIEREPPG
jgi:hypothetical protein